MIERLRYAKMPQSLKKSINQAYLENGTYDQIINHIERATEFFGIEQSYDLPVTTMTNTSKQPPMKDANLPPDPTVKKKQCNYCKKDENISYECYKLKNKREREQNGTEPQRPKCEYCNKVGHTAELVTIIRTVKIRQIG